MNYVLATVMQFNQGSEEVTVKARGRAISKAVDVAEIAMRRFLEGSIEVKDIKNRYRYFRCTRRPQECLNY